MICWKDVLDIIHKSATVIIAAASVYTTRYIYKANKANQEADKQKDRNFQSFKVLILDHNLKFFYTAFENLSAILKEFQAAGLTDDQKSQINERISDEFRQLRIKFVDVLLAVDENLYNSIMEKLDNFLEQINESIFDEGINLSHLPKFETLLLTPFSVLKTDILKTLHQFKG